ncbi:MAG: hypothetical protein ACI4V3_06835 [Faecousia sp.]
MNGRERFMNDRLSEILGRTLADGLGVKNDPPPTNTDPPSSRSEEILLTTRVLQLIMNHILNGGDLFESMSFKGINLENMPENESAPINKRILRYVAKRRVAFGNSAFTQAIAHAQPIIEALMRSRFPHGEEELPLTSEEETLSGDLAWHTALLFCSLHPSIDTVFYQYAFDLPADRKNLDKPVPDAVPLTDAQKGEIETICNGFSRLIPADNINVEPMDILTRYVEAAYAPAAEKPIADTIQLNRFDKMYISTSKASKKQQEIAIMSRDEGMAALDVGGKGKENALVFAEIKGKDGAAYIPNHLEMHLQDVIGQLVQEYGVPMTVSAEQIYRAFTGRFDDDVTAQQEAEIIIAMDRLIVAPASIDYTQQIQNHKRIDTPKDYDKGQDRHIIAGTLIAGERHTQMRNGKSVTVYTIFKQPMFSRYSQIVRQVKQIDVRLIADRTKIRHTKEEKKSKDMPHSSQISARGDTRNVLIRRYLADRITDMQRSKKKKEKYQPRITYESVADHADIDITPRSIRTVRSTVERTLNDFIRLKEIKGFDVYKDGGRSFKGVEIRL